MDKRAVKKIIERRHPDYEELLSHWDFLTETYTGGRAWFENNTFKYHKEGDGEFADRKKRAYRFNHTREVVDLINKYLYRAKVNRNDVDAPDSVKDFWKNTDGRGMDIDEYCKIISKKSSITGCPWVVVDNRNTEINEKTSRSKAQKAKIYSYLVAPQDVLDLSWGEDGELNWILIREVIRDDKDPFDSSGRLGERYRLWTRNEWFLFEGKFKAVRSTLPSQVALNMHMFDQTDHGEHNLGRVPVFRADNVMSDEQWSSPALINDIAYLDRAVANYLSNLDAIIQDQTFSQLAMPAQNVLPGDDTYSALIDAGTKRIFTYDGEGGSKPEFISPDPRQAQLILSAIQQIINEIYHSVGLAGERTKADNSKGIDNSSGVAKNKDFERVNSLLIAKADSMERIENRLAELVALWAGEEDELDDEQELVEYADSFDVRGLYDEFDIAMQLNLIDVPVALRSEQMNNVVKKLFPVLSKELRKRMQEEIKKWEKDLEEQKEEAKLMNEASNNVLEEAKRNRGASGDKQSQTKSRKAERGSEGQANDQRDK